MKKIIFSALVFALFSAPTFAKPTHAMSAKEVKGLISRLHKKIEARKKKVSKLDTKIVRFFLSPSQPKQNENVVVFAQISSRFLDSDTFLEATFDSAPVALEKSAAELWAYDAGSFSEIKSHTFTANVYIQDSAAAVEIKNGIAALDAAISSLNDQIAEEENESTRNQLIAERDLKVGQRTELISALEGLKKSVASETLTFSIAENPAAPGFPRIQAVSPKSGPLEGGTPVTVLGENFEGGMTATLGGAAVTLNFVSSTEVRFETPAFLNEGPKDLEVRISGTNTKNAIRKSAYYASADFPGNSRPVAVAGSPQAITLGATATLNGILSYDGDGDSLTHSWVPLSVPAGSGISVGTPYSTDAQFEFTPTKPGQYLWQLVVTEVGTSPALVSEPSLTVITVNPPANTAPAPTATGITIGKETTGTSQVIPGDADDYQAHSYLVTKQPSLGTATVSSTGLVSFTSGTATGSDTIEILVMDNGTPPLSASVSIPVAVASSTVQVDDLYAEVRARDGFITVGMGADTLSTTAPGIKSVVWDFGDGTSGASSYPYENDGYVEHDYLAAGTYTVTVTLTDVYGITGSNSTTFSTGTSAMPVPRLTSDVFSGPAPLAVNFDASGSTDDVGITSYSFRWFDGSPDAGGSTGLASHTFNEDGDYRVRLVTRDDDGNRSTAFLDIHVGGSPPAEKSKPMPFMNISSKEVLVNTPAVFDATDSYDPNPSGSIAAYRWNFGDYGTCDWSNPNPGCVGSGSNVTYAYPFPYSFRVNLEVEGALGGTAPVMKEVLAVNSGHAPRAMPGRDYLEGVAPFTMSVDGSHSFDYDGTISAYRWEFGDPGCTSDCTSPSPTGSYTYNNQGNYWVNLVVTDDDGNMHDAGYSLVVYPSARVKAQMERRVQAKKALTKGVDHERDKQKNLYAQLCAKGQASACYSAGKMYEEDGNSFAAEKFFEKACTLAYGQACSVRK